MTNTVIIRPESSVSIHEAIMWCDREFGPEAFEINNQFPSWDYSFKFTKPEQAVHFALRWA